MKLLIFGGTGMVGGEVLDCALDDERVTGVLSVGRRLSGRTHTRLREIVHTDFRDYASLEADLATVDACVHCLGTYRSRVTPAEYEEITVGYLAALIGVLARVNPDLRFCLFGAAGASPSGRSVAAFAVVKGRAEAALTGSALRHRHVLRPALIVPGPRTRGRYWPAGLLEALFRVVPGLGVSAPDLGRVMVDIAVAGNAPEVLENAAIRQRLNAVRGTGTWDVPH